jgi:hypothetical protein
MSSGFSMVWTTPPRPRVLAARGKGKAGSPGARLARPLRRCGHGAVSIHSPLGSAASIAAFTIASERASRGL